MKIARKNILILSLLCSLSCTMCPMSIINSVGNGISEASGKILKARYVIPAAIVGLIASYLLYSYFTRESDGDRLQRACQSGDLDTVKSMLEDFTLGGDINAASFDTYWELNCPPIHIACQYGNLDILKYVVEDLGADINYAYTIEFLARVPFVGIVDRAKKFRTPLYTVCENGKDDLVAYLFEKGARVDERCYKRDYFDDEDEDEDDVAVTRTRTPLYIACQKGHLDVVAVLLENGADLESNNGVENDCSTHDEKPLHGAVRSKRASVVRELLRRGAEVDSRNNKGETPLCVAAEWIWRSDSEDSLNVMRALLENGADVNVVDNRGRTALYYACENDDPEIVDLLIARGTEIKDEYRDGGIKQDGDRFLEPSIKQLLNSKIDKKKELEKFFFRSQE